MDQSIDSFKSVVPHILAQFGHEGSLKIDVNKRGFAPLGGGEVYVRQSFVKQLEPISLTDEGKVKRVRGTVPSAKVSPQLTTRVVDKVREVLNDFLPDVWLAADHHKGAQAGKSPGYSVSLVAETSTGCQISKDFTFNNDMFKLPEDLGSAAALALLDEVYYGGCVDSCN
jgi:RNA 3'-terminal phosphate cyclase-like protein